MKWHHLSIIALCGVFVVSLVTMGQVEGFTPAQSSAVFLDPVTIRASTSVNGSTHLSVDATIRSAESGADAMLSFRIESLDASLLLVTLNESLADAALQKLNRYSLVEIQLERQLDVGESIRLHIELVCGDIISQTTPPFPGDAMQGSFIYYVRPSVAFYNFTFQLVLPPHASLSQETIAPIFPETQSNYTDGHSIAFIWDVDELQPGQESVFIAKYEVPLSVVTETSFPLIHLIALAVSSFFFGVLVVKYGPHALNRIRNIGSVKVVGITDDEEEMLDIIRGKGGSCPQKDLYMVSGMSQAKVSLVLSNLEERGLVKRFREGRENIVHIIEE